MLQMTSSMYHCNKVLLQQQSSLLIKSCKDLFIVLISLSINHRDHRGIRQWRSARSARMALLLISILSLQVNDPHQLVIQWLNSLSSAYSALLTLWKTIEYLNNLDYSSIWIFELFQKNSTRLIIVSKNHISNEQWSVGFDWVTLFSYDLIRCHALQQTICHRQRIVSTISISINITYWKTISPSSHETRKSSINWTIFTSQRFNNSIQWIVTISAF